MSFKYWLCVTFLRRNRMILCEVTGRQHHCILYPCLYNSGRALVSWNQFVWQIDYHFIVDEEMAADGIAIVGQSTIQVRCMGYRMLLIPLLAKNLLGLSSHYW